MNPDDKRRSQLASIHILLKRTGLSDSMYRNLLEQLTGRRSAGLLDEQERFLVIRKLNTLIPSDPKMKKIIAQLRLRGRSLAYGEGISERMFKCPLAELNAKQRRAIIAALNYDDKRQKTTSP